MADPYQTLAVSRAATADEIRKAYRALAKKNHPDLHPGDKAAEARFKDIAAAYAIVGDDTAPSRGPRLARGEQALATLVPLRAVRFPPQPNRVPVDHPTQIARRAHAVNPPESIRRTGLSHATRFSYFCGSPKTIPRQIA